MMYGSLLDAGLILLLLRHGIYDVLCSLHGARLRVCEMTVGAREGTF